MDFKSRLLDTTSHNKPKKGKTIQNLAQLPTTNHT